MVWPLGMAVVEGDRGGCALEPIAAVGQIQVGDRWAAASVATQVPARRHRTRVSRFADHESGGGEHHEGATRDIADVHR